MLKVNNKDTRTTSLEHISYLTLVFLLLTLNMWLPAANPFHANAPTDFNASQYSSTFTAKHRKALKWIGNVDTEKLSRKRQLEILKELFLWEIDNMFDLPINLKLILIVYSNPVTFKPCNSSLWKGQGSFI